jgi:cytoskeletal protein CcmA (bactofilin family)
MQCPRDADIASRMALFGKPRDREQATGPAQPPSGRVAPASREVEMSDRDPSTLRGTDGGALTAFLGKGTRITGTLVFEGPSRIEGQVEGEVSAKDVLTIGESAVVNARINGTVVVVHGTITGDVVAETRLEIRAPGKVTGDIMTSCLVVNEGALLDGRCSMRSASTELTRAPTPITAPQPQRHTGS